MVLELDLERIRRNVREATTEDLLDRITAYRSGMEPEAIIIIEEELRDRGVTPAEIRGHSQMVSAKAIFHEDGTAARCSFCYKPAVSENWGWHFLFGRLPVIPRHYYYCEEHEPPAPVKRANEAMEEHADPTG